MSSKKIHQDQLPAQQLEATEKIQKLFCGVGMRPV
jgi:hypothetical protein